MGLAAAAGIWLLDDPFLGVFHRQALPVSEAPALASLRATPAEYVGFALLALLACLATLLLERGRSERFEPYALVGSLLIVHGGLAGSAGAWILSLSGGQTSERLVHFDLCLALVLLGSALILLGLIRIARHSRLRGGVLAGCALMTALLSTWWVVYFLVTPQGAQWWSGLEWVQLPAGRAPERWEGEWMRSFLCLSVAEEDGEARVVSKHVVLEEERLRDFLVEAAARAERGDWDRAGPPEAERPLVLRADARLRSGPLLVLLERIGDLGFRDLFVQTCSPSPHYPQGIRVRLAASSEVSANEGEAPVRVVLGARDGADAGFGPIFAVGGREASGLGAVLPPARTASDRARGVVHVDPDLVWQDALLGIEAVAAEFRALVIRASPSDE